MEVTGLFFYLFSALLVFSGLMVVSARNPVHAVMFLIFAFINAAGLFLLLGAEQVARTPQASIEVRKVETGKGI